jgi:hypothetical protein
VHGSTLFGFATCSVQGVVHGSLRQVAQNGTFRSIGRNFEFAVIGKDRREDFWAEGAGRSRAREGRKRTRVGKDVVKGREMETRAWNKI